MGVKHVSGRLQVSGPGWIAASLNVAYKLKKFLIAPAVKLVADQRMPDGIQMNPYLIGSACFGYTPEQRRGFEGFDFFKPR